jgi:hypothetical protein
MECIACMAGGAWLSQQDILFRYDRYKIRRLHVRQLPDPRVAEYPASLRLRRDMQPGLISCKHLRVIVYRMLGEGRAGSDSTAALRTGARTF